LPQTSPLIAFQDAVKTALDAAHLPTHPTPTELNAFQNAVKTGCDWYHVTPLRLS